MIPVVFQRVIETVDDESISWTLSKRKSGFTLKLWTQTDHSLIAKTGDNKQAPGKRHKGHHRRQSREKPTRLITSNVSIDVNSHGIASDNLTLDNDENSNTKSKKRRKRKTPSDKRRNRKRRTEWRIRKKIKRANNIDANKLTQTCSISGNNIPGDKDADRDIPSDTDTPILNPGHDCPGPDNDTDRETQEDTNNDLIVNPGQVSLGVDTEIVNDAVCFEDLEWILDSSVEYSCNSCGGYNFCMRWCECRDRQYCSKECYATYWDIHRKYCEPVE